MKEKWYKDGLNFSCQGCGGCCCGPGGYVWVTEEEIQAMADRLKEPVKKFMRKYVRLVNGRMALIDNAAGDCIFLNEKGQCKVYEQRPVQCKTFPWWPEIVASRSNWEDNGYDCPGIGHGELIPLEVIERGLKDKS